MNREAVKTEIQNVITANTERIGYKAARKQYAAGKAQIAKLTELGIIDLMPAKFGFSDADAVINAAQDSGKTVVDSFDSATKLNASALYTLLNKAEETVDAEIEMISEQPTAIDGIFYSIDDGYITANVDDVSENLKIRFIGIDEDHTQHAMLLQSDVDAAEKYRAEMETMFSEE